MTESTRGTRTKILMAVVGGAAVVAMGGLSAALGDGITVDSPPVAAPIIPGPMTVGDTVTTTIAPAALATEKAKPQVKAKRFGE
jgi:hypothetical protein